MTNPQLKIGFIGGGNMAQAIIDGLIRAGHAPQCLCVADPDQTQLERIHAIDPDINVTDENHSMAEEAEILVLAVKPQVMRTVIEELPASARQAPRLFLSIAAGITLKALREWLAPCTSIVRVMPNQPALVGAGMSVLTATDETEQAQREAAQYIAAATGETAWIEDEAMMDAVTAVSGSGPAYFYLFAEIIEQCARELGLPPELASQLARQTTYGAGLVVGESDHALEDLRASVTSKGGTTAAALTVLESSDFRAIVERALRAARDRSIELGKAD